MKKPIFTLLLLIVVSITAGAQGSLKGNGQVFFTETFGWENPDDPKGWTAPAGYYFLDPTDNGYNWTWYGMDSLKAQWVNEPPFMSTTAANGSLTLFADKYNEYKDPTIALDNSVGFPAFDCSSHSSVIVRYETVFMQYGGDGIMLMEISIDNWVHSAQFDVSFGCGHKARPNNTQPGVPAIYEANLSDLAAGQPNVQIRFTWRNTDDYFWQIDDFTLSEAWDNDLQMKLFEMEWVDADDETTMTPFFMIPKIQLADNALGNFKASVLNFGEYDQSDVLFKVDITKNNQSVFSAQSPEKNLFPLMMDTVTLTENYQPADYGHYKVTYGFNQEEEESTPQNNHGEAFFHVTDSVFSHADNTSEEAFTWGFEAYGTDGTPNLAHKVGVQYRVYQDCELNSVSAFIAGGLGDGMIDFRYMIYGIKAGSEDQTPVELGVSDALTYDSTMINKWITLPITKDGESEFVKAGDLLYVCVEYNNQHTDQFSKRYENLKIGADISFKVMDPTSVGMGEAQTWDLGNYYLNQRNLMIRLNINEHGNPIDGIGQEMAFSALGQNYPNPFNSNSTIAYNLANGSEVTLEIRDITGRILVQKNEGYVPAGNHSIQIDGNILEPGIYMYTLRAGGFNETRRMTVSR